MTISRHPSHARRRRCGQTGRRCGRTSARVRNSPRRLLVLSKTSPNSRLPSPLRSSQTVPNIRSGRPSVSFLRTWVCVPVVSKGASRSVKPRTARHRRRHAKPSSSARAVSIFAAPDLRARRHHRIDAHRGLYALVEPKRIEAGAPTAFGRPDDSDRPMLIEPAAGAPRKHVVGQGAMRINEAEASA